MGFSACDTVSEPMLSLQKGQRIFLIGNNLGARLMQDGFFETELHGRYPDSLLYIRNMCDAGNTPGFRPHSGRMHPWAFPGADSFFTELANPSGSEGHFESPDEWLSRHQADVLIAFFGYNESFNGPAGLEAFIGELTAFVQHTRTQKYNGEKAAELVLVSPIAFEDLSYKEDLPDGKQENKHLKLYRDAMAEVARIQKVPFVDAFSVSQQWMKENRPLTLDGFSFNQAGNALFSLFLVDQIFGKKEKKAGGNINAIHAAVQEKNWFWKNDVKIPNGVHVFGRRYNPFGPDNYPAEIKKIRQMTANRDTAIWMIAQGKSYDLAAADQQTHVLPAVQTNYRQSDKNGRPEYLYGQDALDKISVPPGYRIELFASEKEFPDLANPVQLSFDNQGRLWVAVMPSYPHYRPGDTKPNDKLIILEDTDGDNRADQQTTFADGLHLPLGFEFAPEGVYLSQGTDFVLLKDTDGDDKADQKEVLLSGFDDHDTHHAHSAYCADPSGAIYMAEGLFLHTNVETAYGPVRATNGGFYRYNPQRRHLERTAQVPIPNPWGIAFDEWGQHYYAETSGPDVRWMLAGSVKPVYGVSSDKGKNLIEEAHRVRPTSGLEFVSSRHFPDEVQGDMLINNSIGFLGTKQHRMLDDGTGMLTKHRQDLVSSTDPNFRPVDMEFAPDGSLYLVDWHNVLIGHMQHNARDPLRDHAHGRIYRITYPGRPLVAPAKVAGATISQLLDNLKLPEYRTRYRSRRELRGRNQSEVLAATQKWLTDLDPQDERYLQHQLEGLWVSWGMNKVDQDLLKQLLQAEDYRVRAASVRVLRYMQHQVPDYVNLLKAAAEDPHGRVRMEAIVAASWLPIDEGKPIVGAAGQYELDDWLRPVYETALAHLQGKSVTQNKEAVVETRLQGADRELYILGRGIYQKDGYCITCHQPDGRGLDPSGFPPLRQTDWVLGDEERLIKLTLHGLMGPITVNGKTYPGQVPMTPFGGLLNDEEVAAVLTYVRNSFGNEASAVQTATVKAVRAATKDRKGFYSPEELNGE
ncbi:MAG: PVC-type heme-binding CxxCH protein [Bacteroidota bacterium]